MAKATIKTERRLFLELTDREAAFILDLIQNPLLHPSQKEPKEELEIRQSIYEALHNPTNVQ